MTVGQTDGATKKAAPPAPKAPAPKAPALAAPSDDEDEVAEPTKVSTKKAEAPKPAGDIASLVGQWDDE